MISCCKVTPDIINKMSKFIYETKVKYNFTETSSGHTQKFGSRSFIIVLGDKRVTGIKLFKNDRVLYF